MMLDRTAKSDVGAGADIPLLTIAEARAETSDTQRGGAIGRLLNWVETYLMKGHPDLGRTGAVCPFTRQAGKIDTVRLAISHVDAADEETAFRLIRRCFRELEAIPCKPGMRHFRTVIVGFPDCDSPEGVAMLRRVQARHKFYSLARARMIGMMHAGSEAPGLWNPDFRPLRAPLPVLAIRHLVENDAPFAARHPLLLVAYLARFPLAGTRRIIAYLRSGG